MHLTFKVNYCDRFRSPVCPVIVTHACSFYGSTRSCDFSAGDEMCLISETCICDGRSGIKVSLLWRKSTKEKKKKHRDQESTDIRAILKMERFSWVCSSSVHQIPSDLFQWLPHNTAVKHTKSQSWPLWIMYLGGYQKDDVFCIGEHFFRFSQAYLKEVLEFHSFLQIYFNFKTAPASFLLGWCV